MSEMPPAPVGVGPLRRPRAILFDWDNTLVDSWATINEVQNFLMRAMGMPEWTIAQTRERTRHSLRDNFPRIFGDRWEEARDIYLERFQAIHLERLTALPGREAMLRGLAGQGIYLGVVSNKTGDVLRREVAWLGWTELFGRVVGAGDAPVDKPACEPVHLALAPSGVAASDEVWFVGDTEIDMECAVNAGCVAVLLREVLPPEEHAREFARFAPALHFADEAGLFQSIEGLRFDPARPSS